MTTTITPDVLKARAPAFSSLSNVTLQAHIDEAVRWSNKSKWGTSHYDDAVFYLACHIAEQMAALADGVAGDTGGTVAPGPVQSERLMSWSVTYSVSEGGAFDDALATTSWGRMYLGLRARQFFGRVI